MSWLVSILIVLCLLAILAAMLMPALSGARMASRKSSSQSNLHNIGLGIFMYQSDNDGRVPPSLDALYPKYMGSTQLFISPRTGERYVYDGTVKPGADPSTWLAWERPDREGQSVLFLAGHVEFMPAESGAETTMGEKFALSDSAKELGLSRASSPRTTERLGRPPGEVPATEADMGDFAFNTTGEKDELAADAAQAGRYVRAMQLAESHRKRGNYADARSQYESALKERPDNTQARSAIESLDELQKMTAGNLELAPPAAPGTRGSPEGAEEEEKMPEEREEARCAAADLLALQDKLKAEGGEGWDDDLAETDRERNILSLLAAGTESLDLGGGATARRGDGELIVEGTKEQISEIQRAADDVRRRMVERAREITRTRQEQQEELAARRRADLKRRQVVSEARARMHGGTLAGSRAAGAMPLEISFPSVGTQSLPFHMDYAGSSSARIELVCLKAGTAMVLQGVVAIVVMVLVGAVSWRGAKSGLFASLALALLLAFLLKVGDEALKQYIVMGIVGLCLAAPLVLTRLAVLTHRRVSHGRARAAS